MYVRPYLLSISNITRKSSLFNILGLTNSSSCTPCTEGYFCKYPGWTNETGSCQPGFYCPKFSTSSQQKQCPPGRYCPTSSHLPKLCPRGTFSNKTELWMETQCSNCTPGYFCDSEGKSSPTGKCKAGYYCPSGSDTMEEKDCPIGFHCPEGIIYTFAFSLLFPKLAEDVSEILCHIGLTYFKFFDILKMSEIFMRIAAESIFKLIQNYIVLFVIFLQKSCVG